MLTPLIKQKIFTNEDYRPFSLELIQQYKDKVKLIQPCPDCKAVVGLNAFGMVLDKTGKPITLVLGCRECDKNFSTPLFL